MMSNRFRPSGAPSRPGGDRRLFVQRHSNNEIIGAKRSKNPRVEIADVSRNAQKWHLTALPLNEGSPEAAYLYFIFPFVKRPHLRQVLLRGG